MKVKVPLVKLSANNPLHITDFSVSLFRSLKFLIENYTEKSDVAANVGKTKMKTNYNKVNFID